ncbi:MAG: hypothetical protein H7831_06710 [Magnetococcus sp. WYHC-3]
MPFKSEAQRRWMHANKPTIAERWEAHTPKNKKLPKRVKKKSYSESIIDMIADMITEDPNINPRLEQRRLQREYERQILEYVMANGPCSCLNIARGTGIDRSIVYRFLYKARCYGNGMGWINNQKTDLNPNTPGQYVITPAGQAVLGW